MASPNKLTPARRRFDKAFKAEALRMLDEGQSVVQVAKKPQCQRLTIPHLEARPQKANPEASELMSEYERLKAQFKRAEMDWTAEAARHPKKKHSDPHLNDLKAMYRFIEDQSQTFLVQLLCQTLQVSRSGYYEWLKPTPPASEPTQLDELKKAATFGFRLPQPGAI